MYGLKFFVFANRRSAFFVKGYTIPNSFLVSPACKTGFLIVTESNLNLDDTAHLSAFSNSGRHTHSLIKRVFWYGSHKAQHPSPKTTAPPALTASLTA